MGEHFTNWVSMQDRSLLGSLRVIGLYSYAVKHYEKVLELAEKVESLVSVFCYIEQSTDLDIAGAHFSPRSGPQSLFDIYTNGGCSVSGSVIPFLAFHLSRSSSETLFISFYV